MNEKAAMRVLRLLSLSWRQAAFTISGTRSISIPVGVPLSGITSACGPPPSVPSLERTVSATWCKRSEKVEKMSIFTFSSRSRKRATSTGTTSGSSSGSRSGRLTMIAESTLAAERRTFHETSSSSE